MKTLLLAIPRRFVKSSILEEIPVRELVARNLANTGNHLDLNRMDFGLEAKLQVNLFLGFFVF